MSGKFSFVTHNENGERVFLSKLPQRTKAQKERLKQAHAKARARELARWVRGYKLQTLRPQHRQAPQDPMSLPLNHAKECKEYWDALSRYVSAAVWRKLQAHARSDETVIPDENGRMVDSYKYTAYHRPTRPEDVEEITQEAITKALECWNEWVVKIEEHLGHRNLTGIDMARYVARRAVYLHWQAQAKLQRQGLQGPDFWTMQVDNRPQNEYQTMLTRVALEEETDANAMELLSYIAQGYTHGNACKSLGISAKTGRRWLNDLQDNMEGKTELVCGKAPGNAVVSMAKSRTIVTTKSKAMACQIDQDKAHRPRETQDPRKVDTSQYWSMWQAREGRPYAQRQDYIHFWETVSLPVE